MKTIKRSIVVKVWKMKRVEQIDTKDFRVVKILCKIL